jgi:hypothetical protein
MFDLVAIANRSLIEMDVAAMAEVACGAVVHVWTSGNRGREPETPIVPGFTHELGQ